MEYMVSRSKDNLFQSVLKIFMLTLVIATIGVYIGQFVPAALLIPLIVIEIGMIIAAFWLRRRKTVSYTFIYIFSLISGITTYPVIHHYASGSGAQIVLNAFVITSVVFMVMAFIGTKTKKDLSFLAKFLLIALIAFLIAAIIGLFWPMSSTVTLVFSAFGSILFSMYVLYDFNQLKRGNITEEEVPLMALSLYLDFVNLFLNILRFLGVISK